MRDNFQNLEREVEREDLLDKVISSNAFFYAEGIFVAAMDAGAWVYENAIRYLGLNSDKNYRNKKQKEKIKN